MVAGFRINLTTTTTLRTGALPRSFRTISVLHLWRSLIIVLCATKCRSDYTIALDIITAFLYKPYYVRCTVSFSSSDSIPATPPRVVFEHNNIPKCIVGDWRSCAMYVPIYTGECGCNFLHRPGLPDKSVHYRMFYYVANVTKAFRVGNVSCSLLVVEDSSFRCVIADRFDFGTMNIIDFTLKPQGDTLYNCSGGSILLPWEFEPTREEVQTRIYLTSYEWIFQHQDIRTITTIATYDYINSIGISKFSDAIIVEDGHRLKKLRIINLSNSHRGTMKIRVHFNGTILNAAWSPQTQSSGDRSTLFELANRLHNNSEHTNYQDTGKVKRKITNEPPLPEYIEDEVRLFMTRPPSSIKITIKAKTDSYGYTNVICKGKTRYYGNPPVNLTLYDHSLALISRSHGRSISHKSLTIEKGNYSCGLTGSALACLPPNDNRCQRVKLDMTGIESEEGHKALDLTLIIYYFETAVCLLLMFWATSLLLDHLLVMVKLKYSKDKKTARRLSQPKKERKDMYRDIQTKRASMAQESRERRRTLSIALTGLSFNSAKSAFNTPKSTTEDIQSEETWLESSNTTASTSSY